ncbi:MAG: ABC transporter ATP-binding protein, partial [Thermaerobacter sp.]|nr:ABC transporter ATP-binding protein [Thermaerobacter sp.]
GGTVLGYDVVRQARQVRAGVSLVAPTADVGIDNNLTVRQNLAFWAPVYGLYGLRARQRIAELLERLHLTDKAEAWPMHISAGQRQRLALARSLLAENRLVFLDEPTNKLDADGVRSVRDLIRDLNTHHGVSVVLTTHVMEEAEELCTDIALLSQGRLLTHMPTADLLRSVARVRPIRASLAGPGVLPTEPVSWPGVDRWTLEPGDQPGDHVMTVWSQDVAATTPALLRWIARTGWRLVRMTSERPSLDDVFQQWIPTPEVPS